MKVALCVGVVAVCAVTLVGRAAAAPSFSNVCPNPPGAPDPGTITDDAIETRNLRIEALAVCVVLTERLDYLALHAERDTDVQTDLRTTAAFGVGVFLASMFGVAFWRTFGRGESG